MRLILPQFHCDDANRLAGFVGSHDPATLLDLARPLLITGSPGTGKTSLAGHLAARIGFLPVWNETGQTVSSKSLAERIRVQAATEFAREFATAIDCKDMPGFRRRFDQTPIMVIDDLHAIAEKPAAQDELAMRLDARDRIAGDAGPRVTIITCRLLPTEIRGLRSSLVSRTLPGLTVPLHPPTGTTRRLILRELMIARLPDVLPEQISMLDAGLEPGLPVRALDAAVKQIAMWCRMNEAAVDQAAIQSAIDQGATRKPVCIKEITTAVARHLGVKSSDMRSGSRRQNIVRARSLAMWLSRRMTNESLTQIGDAFGGRDHSTVLHAIRKTESSIDDDVTLRRAADDITEKLTA